MNGIIAFVLPKNFINCLYYNKLRKYIYEHYSIISIIECDDDSYLETKQETIILIIQKKQNIEQNNKWILKINQYVIFNTVENIKKIKELYNNSTTLNDLDFTVKVGTVVWNQHKDILSDDNQNTRLIYSSDIVNNKLTMKKHKNKQKKNLFKRTGIADHY